MLFPVGKLRLKSGSLEPHTLPECKVAVLEGQSWEWGRLSVREGGIESCKFPKEDIEGPTVEDNMVHIQQEERFGPIMMALAVSADAPLPEALEHL